MRNSLYLELQVLIPVGILLIVASRFVKRWLVRPAKVSDAPATVTNVRTAAAGKV
ncbi:MAG: hypothetical protein L0312_15910 [Acidobacteria bacterium]|nr:hypothetical protein [Acidobacteriota bacterium]